MTTKRKSRAKEDPKFRRARQEDEPAQGRGDGDNPLGVQVQHMDLRKLSTEKLKALKAIRRDAGTIADEIIAELAKRQSHKGKR